jgi:hypothetical protein
MVKFLELRNKIIKKINDNQNKIDRMQKLLLDYDCKQIDNTLTHIKDNSYNIMNGGAMSSQLLNPGLLLSNGLDILRDMDNSIWDTKNQIISLTNTISEHESSIPRIHHRLNTLRDQSIQIQMQTFYKYLSNILNDIFIIYLMNIRINNYIKQFTYPDPNYIFYTNIATYEKEKQIFIYSTNKDENILVGVITDNKLTLYDILLYLYNNILRIPTDSHKIIKHIQLISETLKEISNLMILLQVLTSVNLDTRDNIDTSNIHNKFVLNIIYELNKEWDNKIMKQRLIYKTYICIVIKYDLIKFIIIEYNNNTFNINFKNNGNDKDNTFLTNKFSNNYGDNPDEYHHTKKIIQDKQISGLYSSTIYYTFGNMEKDFTIDTIKYYKYALYIFANHYDDLL